MGLERVVVGLGRVVVGLGRRDVARLARGGLGLFVVSLLASGGGHCLLVSERVGCPTWSKGKGKREGVEGGKRKIYQYVEFQTHRYCATIACDLTHVSVKSVKAVRRAHAPRTRSTRDTRMQRQTNKYSDQYIIQKCLQCQSVRCGTCESVPRACPFLLACEIVLPRRGRVDRGARTNVIETALVPVFVVGGPLAPIVT